MAKSERLELGDNIYGQFIGLYSTTVTYLANKGIEFGEKTQNMGYYAVQGHWRSPRSVPIESPYATYILVINSNWQPISYGFGVIAAYCSNFGHLAFLSHPWRGGVKNNVRFSSWAHRKARNWLPIVLIDFFSLDIMAEALRAKIDRKSATSLQRGHFNPKFQVEGDVPHQSFFHGKLGQWMPYNSVADSFHTKKLCSRLSLSEVRF